jgi:hypothetical protein
MSDSAVPKNPTEKIFQGSLPRQARLRGRGLTLPASARIARGDEA